MKTIEEIEALREKQRLYSAEYYRKKKAQRAHAEERRGPVKKEEKKLELKLEFDKQNN